MINLTERPQPINHADLKKDIIIPREILEEYLQYFDWTYQQIERGEFPAPFTSLEEFQKGIIDSDRILWAQSFLREPEDPDHQDPYSIWNYQEESLRYNGHTLHKTAAEVGKTREIVAYALHMVDTSPNGSGLIGAQDPLPPT